MMDDDRNTGLFCPLDGICILIVGQQGNTGSVDFSGIDAVQ